MIAVFFLSFCALLAISCPIMVALGGCSLIYSVIAGNIPLTTLVQTTFSGLASFPLLAVPLFMLAGNLMNAGGITPRLVAFAPLLLGHIRGGVGSGNHFGLRRLRGHLRRSGSHRCGHRGCHDPGHEEGWL